MDMNVNTSAFHHGINKLKNHCRYIEFAGKAILNNLRVAHESFDSVNFVRAENAVASTLVNVNSFFNEIEKVEKTLKKLENCVEKYIETGYKG